MFNNFKKNKLNQMKIDDIKEKHSNLEENEFLRIFFSASVAVDLKYNEKFEINKEYLSVGKLKGFTDDIVLYDVLKMIPEGGMV